MKVLLIGGSGYIGSAVLKRLLAEDSITTIIALTRRQLSSGIPDPKNKLQIIQHSDFSQYPAHLLDKFKSVQACIYCLGTNVPIKSPEMNRRVNYEYAIETAKVLARVFKETEGTEDEKLPFRFVYLSGALPEKDPERSLYFLAKNRRMRGELENELLRLNAKAQPSAFKIYIARPGFVQESRAAATVLGWTLGWAFHFIELEGLAVALVRLALKGHEETLIENAMLKRFK